jgi:hypothetical protein
LPRQRQWSGRCQFQFQYDHSGHYLLPDAGSGAAGVAFFESSTFITPPGYKPIGPVSIWCAGAGYVAARGW